MNGCSAAGALDRQPDLLARLQNVVRQLNRSDIRTVAALIAKVVGDQNAGLMAVRLLHWFSRSKKVGGWVYKSWQDWNAECNLSQAQVKRVHGKGFLEMIGIERTIMKANGTPTVHYRLDENQLIQRLGEFLDIMPIRIKMWMWTETPNEDSQSSSSQQADSDQPDEHHHPNSFDEDEPKNSAESAQSTTDSDLQTRQHKYNQDIQHNSYSAAVVDTEREEKKEIFQSLRKLGIGYLKTKELIEKHGHKRVAEVIQHTKDQDRKNPAGYTFRHSQKIGHSGQKRRKKIMPAGMAYITGKYAAFINH